MKNFLAKWSTSEVIAALSVATTLWAGFASAAQPAKLGYAETAIGGELALVEETCTFHSLGTGYALYLTNPRGTTIGNGCAMVNALPPELGMFMVQWGASPVHGAESYQIDDFTWTVRGRAVMAHILKARYEAKVRMQTKDDAKTKEQAANAALVAAYNKPEVGKTYLGVAKGKGYPSTILITPKQCRLMVEAPSLSSGNNTVMEWNNNGRTVLGLSSSGDKVVKNGCALPNSGGSITVKWDYEHDRPERFTAEQISWEPEGQEWIGTETAKKN